MAEHRSPGQVIENPADGVHLFSALFFLGVIEYNVDGFALSRLQLCKQAIRRFGQNFFGVESAYVCEVVEAAAVMKAFAVKMAIKRGYIPFTPREGDKKHHDAEVFEVLVTEPSFQRAEKVFQLGGESNDLEHEGGLRRNVLYNLQHYLPWLPSLSTRFAEIPPKSQST
jgi:hypothetical protein